MSKCLKCREEITTLSYSGIATVFQRFDLSNGYPNYETESMEFGSEDNEFTCPVCCGLLFDNDEEATKFLKGEENE